MAGIYLHIPFCKQKCSYCDFHFSTDSSYHLRMMDAIHGELELKKESLKGQTVQTIYFGGGTPSLIAPEQLSRLLKQIHAHYDIESDLEVTIEANPDDLDGQRLSELKRIGVNRLSIGIQSFDDEILTSMNRGHNSDQALSAVGMAQEEGFQNISVDIIYGLPGRDLEWLKSELDRFLALGVQHISAYQLTIEPRTSYAHQVDKGLLRMPKDEKVAEQFEYLIKTFQRAGFEQYEVSNFAKDGFVSKHNSSYWRGKPYLGVGPSAHSYDGRHRYWNVANNHRYMKAIEDGTGFQEQEELDSKTRFNEYILTRSRTKWGLDLAYILEEFNIDLLDANAAVLRKYADGYSILEGHLRLNEKGLLLADGFASDLFLID